MDQPDCCPMCGKAVASTGALVAHLDYGHAVPDPLGAVGIRPRRHLGRSLSRRLAGPTRQVVAVALMVAAVAGGAWIHENAPGAADNAVEHPQPAVLGNN